MSLTLRKLSYLITAKVALQLANKILKEVFAARTIQLDIRTRSIRFVIGENNPCPPCNWSWYWSGVPPGQSQSLQHLYSIEDYHAPTLRCERSQTNILDAQSLLPGWRFVAYRRLRERQRVQCPRRFSIQAQLPSCIRSVWWYRWCSRNHWTRCDG
ncbi:hypothetical protein BDW74DRAFT_147962 [Aspergillus multicolor]|uniref:uncharacterized protein n=1 Tax=Aspergillus multicolor TaxID=41759 RepID=UPI003CCCBF5B